MFSPVLRMPACTRVQGQSANRALLSTPPPSAAVMATPTPPRYLTHAIVLSEQKGATLCPDFDPSFHRLPFVYAVQIGLPVVHHREEDCCEVFGDVSMPCSG